MDKIRQKKPHIAVVGDLMVDHYIWGKCERISPEAPVQVLEVEKENSVLGGAGNVISNLIAMESRVDVFTVLGEDNNAKTIISMLQKSGIVESIFTHEIERITTKKSRIIASNQQIIRFDDESKQKITPASEIEILKYFTQKIERYDAILLSDYDKGVLTPTLTQKIITLAKKAKIPVLVDPKGKDYSKYYGAMLITPNKKEASEATGLFLDSNALLKEAGFKLKNELNLTYGMITLSEEGIAIFDKDMEIIPTVAREIYDVTGAGDTVLASLGVAIASGLNIRSSCEFANKAAAVVVAKVGSATATLNEIEEYEHSLNKGQAESKIKNFEQIKWIAKRLKAQGKRVIFTNGCFDILHRGHASYLQQAKELGDVLIVGLNSDESIKRLKGETRPVNLLEDRAYLLAALESVDYVVSFNEDTPYNLIKQVMPNILVKGADYRGKKVAGSDIVPEIRLIDFIEGKSTSAMIDKIKC
ncbi:MAG: D-glycero-beta-D-manno-heptose-7-phosphate kinase [Sulfurovum sp.]|nr:D-glycero-beta-D-manno-heptose-7-phosphate kinase [Sulfurovum sp.]MCB4744210.1 D-glycero-beta-D-manno-heptose-7-phosphate kinase [Sulfurovum sp.]MCB4745574.1 D-glycero-beta-D-manno-heptose-7-phosphate kinase [Sulfurovum sp.]MCB4747833.1 D-glycero-beta-D-manno-heptose-7-phosphate kinase [Sulfurovum sp.]MCB4749211.1 D-glycero-beta-D-manno-heptose-7-phosphate kinase [Sulfurovum sp.]